MTVQWLVKPQRRLSAWIYSKQFSNSGKLSLSQQSWCWIFGILWITRRHTHHHRGGLITIVMLRLLSIHPTSRPLQHIWCFTIPFSQILICRRKHYPKYSQDWFQFFVLWYCQLVLRIGYPLLFVFVGLCCVLPLFMQYFMEFCICAWWKKSEDSEYTRVCLDWAILKIWRL